MPSTEFRGLKISHIAHDCFKFNYSKVAFIDPFKLKFGEEKADVIFITHDHSDHLSIEDINKIKKDSTIIVAPLNAKEKLSFFPEANVVLMKEGESKTVDALKVKAVPAYNINKKFHQKGFGLGYIIDFHGVRVYHAGDTDEIPEMKKIECDVALLPVSGTYVMTATEAALAAQKINAKLFIPMHYGSVIGSREDAETFKDQCSAHAEVRILL
ncbi:MAG: MBL fold metallo-hydrolase [archaeon]|nr:MBL fold metallo-hydrolase [archaeon]